MTALLRLWHRLIGRADAQEHQWAPTGIRYTTERTYLYENARKAYERSRAHSETGRKLPKPKKSTHDNRANVLPMRRAK